MLPFGVYFIRNRLYIKKNTPERYDAFEGVSFI